MLPPRPSTDVSKLSASWLCRLLDCVDYAMRHPKGDGRTILTDQGILRAVRRSGGGGGGGAQAAGTFPCKILSKEGAFYNVETYRDGIDGVSTGTEKLFVLSVPLGENVPSGTWVMASESAMGVTGGGYVP
jgi:hypothetical protein